MFPFDITFMGRVTVAHMPYPLADESMLVTKASSLFGDIIGQVHFPQKPELDPITYKSKTEGILIGRTHKALVYPGDFLALVAQEIK